MARRATEAVPEDAVPVDASVDPADPPLNPAAVRDAYRLHRARRKSRIEHRRRTKRAGMRFWLAFVVLLVASLVIAVTIWHEIQQLFGF
jgi:hypothetical protein